MPASLVPRTTVSWRRLNPVNFEGKSARESGGRMYEGICEAKKRILLPKFVYCLYCLFPDYHSPQLGSILSMEARTETEFV